MKWFWALAIAIALAPSVGLAASPWYEIHPKTGNVGDDPKESARAGHTYQTTIDSDVESLVLVVSPCRTASMEGPLVTGTYMPVKCESGGCLRPVNFLEVAASQGEGFIGAEGLAAIKVSNATSGDVITLTCGVK